MHYNQFTIDYIKSIKRNLKIEQNSNGLSIFIPDSIDNKDIANLKHELESIWQNSESSVSLLRNKHDATVQAGLFGLVNDLDKALKVGFLLADRIVLIDFLYERILLKQTFNDINLTHLGAIANLLVDCLPLAEEGRIVIIPNPYNWFLDSQKVIEEVSESVIITAELMTLLNMLSITNSCNLHPYTIAESNTLYQSILYNHVNHTDIIGKEAGQYSYKGILGALLTEKLLDKTELKIIYDIPITEYFNIIVKNKEFYFKYLERITTGGSIDSQYNIELLKNSIIKDIEYRNNNILDSIQKTITVVGALGSGTIALLGATSIISAPLSITGAALGLSATLAGLLISKEKSEDLIISVFSKLYNK